MNAYLRRLIVVAMPLSIGCGLTITVPRDELLKESHGSPLQRIHQLSFIVNRFEDARDLARDSHWIGQCGNYTMRVDAPAADVVTQSIANALERNGHRVLKSDRTVDADVVVDGIVRLFSISRRQSTWGTMAYTAWASGEISVSGAAGERLLSRRCRGTDSAAGFLMPCSEGTELLRRALSSMVEDCTADPEFLDALRELKRRRVTQ